MSPCARDSRRERLVIAGTPESVAEQILPLRREVGAFGTLLYTGHDWADPALAQRSMELTAKEVWPRITRSERATTAGAAVESSQP